MARELADWLNRIGMVLGFVSFWLVAPEFIGEGRLRSWEHSLAAGLLQMPKIMRRTLLQMSIVSLGVYVVRYALAIRAGHMALPEVPQSWLLAFGVVSATLVASQIVVQPLVSKLANDTQVRQTALFLGAGLFVLSFALQFISTFQHVPDH